MGKYGNKEEIVLYFQNLPITKLKIQTKLFSATTQQIDFAVNSSKSVHLKTRKTNPWYREKAWERDHEIHCKM